MDARCKASETALQASRTKYLEQQCVLDAAETLANEAEALLASLGLSQGADGGPGGISAGGAPPSLASTSGRGLPDGSGSSLPGSAAGDAKAHAALRGAGLTCSVATYSSVSRHLQAARAMQRLKLPEVSAPGAAGRKPATPGGSAADQQQQQQQRRRQDDQQQADADCHPNGSTGHLLGVTPDTLKNAYCLSRAAAQVRLCSDLKTHT